MCVLQDNLNVINEQLFIIITINNDNNNNAFHICWNRKKMYTENRHFQIIQNDIMHDKMLNLELGRVAYSL